MDYGLVEIQPRRGIVESQAKKLGVKYVMCSWIPHDQGPFSEKNAREAIEVFNTGLSPANSRRRALSSPIIATVMNSNLSVTEPSSTSSSSETNPDAVFFELDVFWPNKAGPIPPGCSKKYGSRFKLMHLKDLRRGAVKNFTGGAPDEESVPLGQGEVDWKSGLKSRRSKPRVEY